MRAREVHAILNRELGPAMQGMGFQRTGAATATWRQPVDPDGIDPSHLFVRAHIGQSGFSDHLGNWFTIELVLVQSATYSDPFIGRPASYFDFLAPADKQRLLPLVNQARAAIPGLRTPQADLTSYDLPYFNEAHVAAYAEVLRDTLPHVITVFALTRGLPPPPEVTEAL